MSSDKMTAQVAGGTGDSQVTTLNAAASPRTRARITGVVYLFFFLTAVLGAFFAPEISGLGGVSSDAVATANTILAHEPSFWLGWALGLISTVCYIALIALFYQLFKPVSRTVALLAAFFGLVGCAIKALQSLFQLAPLVVLGGSPYLGVFSVKQLQALALLSLNLNVQAGSIALVFFGVFQLLIGYLIFRSTFLPRMLGALIALAGLGWLTFLAPLLANYLLTYIEILGILAEVSLMLWLLVMGVNAQHWQEQASAAGASIRIK
jgi:MFS family permease